MALNCKQNTYYHPYFINPRRFRLILMSIYGELADRIRGRRKELRITQGELAERSGLSFAVIQSLERGNTDPRKKTLEAVAKGLELSMAELLGEDTGTDATPVISESAIPGPLTAKDCAAILSRFADISPERRAVVLGILFDDASLVPESPAGLLQLLSTIG